MADLNEDEEALAEEVGYQETMKALKELGKKYKALVGTDPTGLSIAEIQNAIVAEMKRRD